MRPANRLFQIILLLRRGRVLTAQQLAEELGVCLRTVYRDIKTLILSGVPVEGEAGVGYSLRRDFYLPPLMLTDDELQALVLGAQMVQTSGDSELGRAAGQALNKIESALPNHIKVTFQATRDSILSSAAAAAAAA